MIQVNIEKSKMINQPYSAFLTFKYDEQILQTVKSLSVRKYHPQDKRWEIEVEALDKLKKMLPHEKFIIQNNHTNRLSISESELTYFKSSPMQHQIECINFGLNNPKMIIGDEQGLGKTAESLYIAVLNKHYFHHRHTLILSCVNKLKWNWQKEAEQHTFEKAHVLGARYTQKGVAKAIRNEDKLADLKNIHAFDDCYFLITNIESLRNEEIANRLVYLCSIGLINTIIVDEIHKCKNARSAVGQNLLRLSAPSCIALSGTLLINNPLDLYIPLRFIGVETMPEWQFRRRYQTYTVIKRFGEIRKIPNGYQNLDELQRKYQNYKIRRKKEDVLNLPDKIVTTEVLEMSESQKRIYEEVRTSLLKDVDKIKTCSNPLEKLTRLRQVTSMPSLITSSAVDNCKMERMEEIVEEIVLNGGKAIIYSNWAKVVVECVKRLKKYSPASITGKTVDTESEKEKFMQSEKCKVIVGTIGAMGTGYTLTAATAVLFIDSPWTDAARMQAEDRAHRIGTSHSVNVIYLICKDTVDERVQKLVESKKRLSDILLDSENKQDILDYLLNG